MEAEVRPTHHLQALAPEGSRRVAPFEPRTLVALFLLLAAVGNTAPPSRNHVANDFDGQSGLSLLGWRVQATPAQSEWSIKDGHLEMLGHRSPYKGGSIAKTIPLFERGVLEFDAQFATAGRTDYQHFSLGFRLYGHMTAFKNYGTHAWLQYRPGQNTWATVATAVPFGKWVHFKVIFDFPAKRVEYYCGDGEDPAFVDPALELDLSKAPNELVFFNYGLCNGTIANRIDNITLRDQETGHAHTPTQRDGFVIFEGMTADRFDTRHLLAEHVEDDTVAVYRLVTRGSAIAPRNIFRLQHVPGQRRLEEARLIVLADVPATPNACAPEYLLNDIATAVQDGAHLLILAGMFSLGKGGYQETPLAKLFPMEPLTPWDGQRFSTPAPMTGPLMTATPAKHAEPTVLWYHNIPQPSLEADTLLQAHGKPMALRWPVGKGTVTVFLAMACGDFRGTNQTPFWQSPAWPELLRGLAGHPAD